MWLVLTVSTHLRHHNDGDRPVQSVRDDEYRSEEIDDIGYEREQDGLRIMTYVPRNNVRD